MKYRGVTYNISSPNQGKNYKVTIFWLERGWQTSRHASFAEAQEYAHRRIDTYRKRQAA